MNRIKKIAGGLLGVSFFFAGCGSDRAEDAREVMEKFDNIEKTSNSGNAGNGGDLKSVSQHIVTYHGDGKYIPQSRNSMRYIGTPYYGGVYGDGLNKSRTNLISSNAKTKNVSTTGFKTEKENFSDMD